MKKFKCFIIAFLGGILLMQSQSFPISGNVTDENNVPLLGVNVLVKNENRGTTTDFDGNFTLENVSPGDVVTFSYVGFFPKEVTVTDNSFLQIDLLEDTEALDEVVVIGYGSQQRKDITGAVSSVSAKTIEELNPIKLEQALQGTAAGVNVTPTSGAPGAEFNITIRGIASNSENQPLVIIDGYQGDLGTLNPSDVASISVLKDAQAAIYGIAGANGVILITTKSGEKNTAPTLRYDAYTGIQETSRQLPLLNATEYALITNEAFANNGSAIPFPDVSELGMGTDFQDAVFDTAPVMSHNLSLSGGSERVTYALGGSHLYQEGIVGRKKADFTRSTARFSLGVDITEKFKFSANSIYTNIDRPSINENGLGSVLFNALNFAPTFGLQEEDLLGKLGNEVINPLSQIANTFNDYKLNKFNGSASLEFIPVEEVVITSRFGYSLANSKGKSFAPISDFGAGKVFNNPRSRVDQNRISDNSYTYDLFGTYDDLYNEVHHVTFTGGMTVINNWGDGLFASGFDVPNNSWEFADISLTPGLSDAKSNSSYIYDIRKLSFFGRVQYDYKGKYLFSGMLRRDASTRFSPENRVGYFPSATAGWILSEEDFLNESKVVSFLKLRGSYGVLGNDEVGRPQFYRSLLSGEATYVFDGMLVNGTAPGVISNPNAGWEEAEKTNIGIDLRLYDNKFDITLDLFREDRKDLLIADIPVSGILGGSAPGAGAPTINAGTTRNQGLELAVKYSEYVDDNFNFSLGYTATFLDNSVTQVNGAAFQQGGAFSVGLPAPARFQEGFPIGYFYGLRTDGIFQTQAEIDAHPSQAALGAEAAPGDIRYVDINGDGEITIDDRTNIGGPIAYATMGLNLTANYKNFDFVSYVYASLGNEMIRNYERDQINVNRQAYVLDRWTGPGTSNEVPRVTTGATSNLVFSDYFVEDASYARIQNVQLGYTIPENALASVGISTLRVYASVNNLYTFTKYRGFDPAATDGAAIGGGIDYGFYPTPRIYLAGINLNF